MTGPKWPLQEHVVQFTDADGTELTVTLREEIGYRVVIDGEDGSTQLPILMTSLHASEDLTTTAKRAVMLAGRLAPQRGV